MEKQQLKFTLDAEKMVMGSVQILYQGQDLVAGVSEVLKRLGKMCIRDSFKNVRMEGKYSFQYIEDSV